MRETENIWLGFLAEQKITQTHQFVVGVETKFDAAAAPRTHDGDVRAETRAQAGFEVELLRRKCDVLLATLGSRRRRRRRQALQRAHRQAFADRALRQRSTA